jgi:hypothetical protein
MNARIERLVRALLYEGYALYPYRPSSVKNRFRWTFGLTGPGEALGTQMLVEGPGARFTAEVLFLQPKGRGEWQEARERRVRSPELALEELLRRPHGQGVAFAAEPEHELESIAVALELSAERAEPGFRVTARVRNATAGETDPRGLTSLASTNVVLSIAEGAFVSLQDPPEAWRAAAAGSRAEGAWPVLAGPPGDRSVVLASPIILEDHPEVADESPGDLFDATEIDEILTLRILTLTLAEKAELRASDPRARALLKRTEQLGPAELARLHGALRSPRALAAWKPGDHVRLAPRGRGDVLDLALRGRAATVVGVERDVDGRVHVLVTVDDDPGRDLGLEGEPGHRFFFAPDELERRP